jgi:hypothetical protein
MLAKPYTPSISDALKLNAILMMMEMQKETIRYSIFSFPVASHTIKGKAEGVDKAKRTFVQLCNTWIW